MRYFILTLFCIIPCRVLAQGELPNTLCYWQDDQNIRLHTTYLLGNMRANGVYGATRWDTISRHYVSTIPELLCYRAITQSGYRKAVVKAVALEGYPYYTARAASRNAEQMAHTLDSIINNVRSYETFTLTYNKDGYLRSKTHKQTDAKERFYKLDTTTYAYRQEPDGSSRISSYYAERQVSETPGYQSVWCGDMGAPLTRISHGSTIYRLNAGGLVVSIETDHSAFANNCRDYTPEHKILTVTYDDKGRAKVIIDSSITYAGRNMTTEMTYTERSAADMADSAKSYRLYKALQLPLVRRALAANNGVHYVKERATQTVFTEYSDKKHIQWITGNEPEIKENDEIVAYDEHETMLLKVENHYAYDGILLYQYGQDSGGTYRGRYGTAGIPQPDTATYQPDQADPPLPFNTIISGSDTYRRQQKRGVIYTPHLDYNERNVSPATNGWQIISYEREMDGYNYNYYMRDEYFWTPAVARWRTTHPPFTHFIVIGPDGLTRYVYDQGTLYRISYQK